MTKNIFVIFLAILVIATLSNCSKNPHDPGEPEIPIHDHDPVIPDTVIVVVTVTDTVFVEVIIEVPILCKKTDIDIDFTGIIDQSQPNVMLAKVAGFPDETITETETASIPTEKTYHRSYKGFLGGAISFERISGSRAAAVKIEVVRQVCSE